MLLCLCATASCSAANDCQPVRDHGDQRWHSSAECVRVIVASSCAATVHLAGALRRWR